MFKRILPLSPAYHNLVYLYMAIIILSNLSSNKLTVFLGQEIDAGFLFFPITYFINDVVTEIYGYKKAREMILKTFFINLIFTLGFYYVIYMPAADTWPYQKSFVSIFELSPKIFIASTLSYFVGELSNSRLLVYFKQKFSRRYAYFRFLLSTSIAAALENLLFYFIVFYGVVEFDVLIKMILLQYALKIIVEAIIAPTYYLFKQNLPAS